MGTDVMRGCDNDIHTIALNARRTPWIKHAGFIQNLPVPWNPLVRRPEPFDGHDITVIV